MLDYLSAPEGVLALRAGGHIGRDELTSMVDRMERALGAHETVHVFVEVVQLSGFDMDGMTEHVRRAMGMLRQLRKFGRIAVVADQSWVRWGTRLESALLPYVTYEVFTPDQRDRAFAWVVGDEVRPRGPALSIIETDQPSVVGFEIDGKPTAEELRAIAGFFEERLRTSERLDILGRVKSIGGFEMRGLVEQDFIGMKRALVDRVDRYALVGGPSWLRHWVSLLDGMMRIDIRHFEAGREAEAWNWLGATPAGQRPLVA